MPDTPERQALASTYAERRSRRGGHLGLTQIGRPVTLSVKFAGLGRLFPATASKTPAGR